MSRAFYLGMAFLGFAGPACPDQRLWNAKPVAVRSVEIALADAPDTFVVKLNGDDLDLAYAFARKPQNAKISTNLGLLAKCDEAANFDNQDPPLGVAASP